MATKLIAALSLILPLLSGGAWAVPVVYTLNPFSGDVFGTTLTGSITVDDDGDGRVFRSEITDYPGSACENYGVVCAYWSNETSFLSSGTPHDIDGRSGTIVVATRAASVPEPSAIGLFGIALSMLFGISRARHRNILRWRTGGRPA